MTGEDRLLRGLARQMARPMIGDDAAVLPAMPPGSELAATVDSQIAGVHFVADLDPACLAERLLAVNLSDLAAMGAIPTHALLALTAPPAFPYKRFFRALLAACDRYHLRLAGGDLSRAVDPALVATLTLLGRRAPGGRWLRRGGAAPGEALWLGGSVGESAAGRLLIAAGARWTGGRVTLPPDWPTAAARASRPLAAAARRAVRRHLRPEPQLALGRWLGRQPAGAAMDVSDGVALDLSRLCAASKVGARIEASRLPLAGGFAALCDALGASPDDLALGGGEDYVLLFTLPPAIVPPARFGCHRIGVIQTRRRLRIDRNGKLQPLQETGWDHLRS